MLKLTGKGDHSQSSLVEKVRLLKGWDDKYFSAKSLFQGNCALFFAFAICFFFSIAASAQIVGYGSVEDKGNFDNHTRWTLYDSGTLVISGSGAMPEVSRRPYRDILVEKAVVCEGVTQISSGIFKNCKNLTDVSLPSSLKHIGYRAFENCTNLEDISLPEYLESIDVQSFKGCKNLKRIVIPDKVTEIGSEAFAACKSLRQISLPKGLKTLGPLAFRDSPAIYECVQLPDFITPVASETYGLSADLITGYWSQKERKENRKQRKSRESESDESSPSDPVDIDIPATGIINPNLVAVIVSNESYSSFEPVDFASNDGDTFAKYCRMTLGVEEEHILRYKDATNSQMKGIMRDLTKIAPTFRGDMQLLFYYAGHGTHDAKSKEAYLIPTDALQVSRDDCFALTDLYFALGEMPIKMGIVFMDACFSGASRNGNMLQQGRSIKEAPEEAYPSGNVVVLSSTNGDQIAMPHLKSKHGLFTYYLLKELQASAGNITLDKLASSLSDKVNRYSLLLNSSEQNPTLSPSDDLPDSWKSWKLIP